MSILVKNAFVLGAGLGTRLRSLTALRPKPLIPICNRPLITFAFDHLLRVGVTKFVVNTHHRPEAYARIFPDNNYHGVPIFFRHEESLLETGGGIKNVEDLLRADSGNEPFLVHNGDILSDLPVEKAVRHHIDAGNEVTLVLRSSGGPLAVSLDERTGLIKDIGQRRHPDTPGKFLFTGIYVVSPEFLKRIPALVKISVVPIFLLMIRHEESFEACNADALKLLEIMGGRHKLGGIVLDEGHWWDLGTREQYLAVHRHLKNTPVPAFRIPHWIHPSARIAPTAQISGATVIGENTVVGENVHLSDCILWENAEIASGSSLRNCIVTNGQRVEGTHTDTDF